MDVPAELYDLVRQKLLDAGYDHAVDDQAGELDMHGIALAKEQPPVGSPPGRSGASKKRKSGLRPTLLGHLATDLIAEPVKGLGDVVGVSVSHGLKRPSDDVALDRPDLREQICSVKPPIFKYVGHRAGDMNVEPSHNKRHRLRIGPGETVVHNLWDVLWGRDGNCKMR
jgi:hypothetical protein